MENMDCLEEMRIEENNILNDNQTGDQWAHIVDGLIKSFDHNADSVLDISNEVTAIKTLAPDDIYRQLILQTYQDEKMTTIEKNNQALQILRQRMDDQKESAAVVKDLQSKKAENFDEVSTGHFRWAGVVTGGVIFGLLTFTPGGRYLAKKGLQLMVKGMTV